MNQKPLDAPALNAFTPATLLQATPAGIQVIINFAPQTSIVQIFSIEQIGAVLKQCMELRQKVGKVDSAAIDAMVRRKDLKLV